MTMLKTSCFNRIFHFGRDRYSEDEDPDPKEETFAQEIIRKRLARGDIEEEGIIKRRRGNVSVI